MRPTNEALAATGLLAALALYRSALPLHPLPDSQRHQLAGSQRVPSHGVLLQYKLRQIHEKRGMELICGDLLVGDCHLH